MTINEKLIAALSPAGHPVVPGQYAGSQKIYYSFNYSLHPRQFADNKPLFFRVLIQVHLYTPHAYDSVQLRADTLQQLLGAGFDCPEILDVSDDVSQHYVFETGSIESVRNMRKE